MAGTYPDLEVSFAFGVASSAVPSGGDWVDVSSYIPSVGTVAGRDDEFNQPSAGQLDLRLDNLDGRFDPDNTTGPYYGQLLPLTWVRLRGGGASVTDDVFYGQVSIEGFRLTASGYPGSVRVEVLDFEQLSSTLLPESVYAIEVQADTPTAWYRLSEGSGTVAVDSSGNGRHGTYEGGATFSSRTGLVVGSSDNAIGFDGVDDQVGIPTAITTAAFTVEAWVSRATVSSTDPNGGTIFEQGERGQADALSIWIGDDSSAIDGLVAVRYGDSPGVTTTEFSTVRVDDGDPHHVVVTMDSGGVVTIYVDGVDATGGFGTAGTVPPSTTRGAVIGASARGGFDEWIDGTLDEVAFYGTDLTAARVLAHYTAGTAPWASELTSDRITHLLDVVGFPSTLRTIDTGQSTMAAADLRGGDLLSALLDVNKAERGELYIDHHDGGKIRFRDRHARWTETRSVVSQATFGDGGGSEVPYTELDLQDDRIINSATVQRTGGANVTATDAASVTQYQTRSHSETGLLLDDEAEVEARANLIVAEKADRHRRVRSMTLEPLEDTDLAWAQVFTREIGDRITVKWRPLYGGTYSWDSWIVGIRHAFEADFGRLRTTFSLQPVPYEATGAPYFIVGTSTVSGPARIGY